MSASDTYEILCILVEEGAEPEDVAGAIMVALERQGEDLLAHLDPPLGLQRWLRSHGLSLVALSEATPPKVWDAIEVEEGGEVQTTSVPPRPVVQVGDYVEYHTAPSGPHHQSSMGSGRVTVIHPAEQNGELVIVYTGPGQPDIWLDSELDIIRVVGPEPEPQLPPQ